MKPPIGLMPEWLWREHRAADLAAAIHRQFTTEGHTPDQALIRVWADELYGLSAHLHRPLNTSQRNH